MDRNLKTSTNQNLLSHTHTHLLLFLQMADMEVDPPAAAAPAAAAPAAVEEIDQTTALQRVLRKALIADGLRRGLHECVKALAKAKKGEDGQLIVGAGGARLCCLAHDCDEKQYVSLVKALCNEKGVPLIEVPLAIQLGEWAGLCKLDKDNKPRKVVSTSVVVVTDFGEASHELDVLQSSLKKGE